MKLRYEQYERIDTEYLEEYMNEICCEAEKLVQQFGNEETLKGHLLNRGFSFMSRAFFRVHNLHQGRVTRPLTEIEQINLPYQREDDAQGEKAYIRMCTRKFLLRLIAKLPRRYEQAVRRYLEGATILTIARELDVKISNATALIYEGIKRLKNGYQHPRYCVICGKDISMTPSYRVICNRSVCAKEQRKRKNRKAHVQIVAKRERPDSVCQECGAVIVNSGSKPGPKRRFCSPKCRMRHFKKQHRKDDE